MVSRAGDPLITRAPAAPGIYSQFKLAAEAAYPRDIDRPPSTEIQRRFMRTGFELINVACGAYIEAKADRQRQLNVWRDAFAPITALAGGIVLLANNGEKVDSDGLTALALFTTAANAGFEIYEQRYLFGAKNVDSVRRLVLAAQVEHAGKAMELTQDDLAYTTAVLYLRENQMICSPGSILELVNKAIDAGQVQAIPTSTKTAEQATDSGATQPDDNLSEKANLPATATGKPAADRLFDSIRIKIAN
ncbi:hypothetical protein [Novosphingobium sp. JCM 18896]|uniref:hypothetical protein n=1 Tax=Novosphingobium sp. JCM 18896 TaxID=2989731 RepID=UPI002221DE29|nr:hypothetical protein [Novosphingobium sp. JCM 18896]MCW1430017.1 hypothetical protein [Novosphingobium sp. JCM 18896]